MFWGIKRCRMRESIEVGAAPSQVWEAWEKAYQVQGGSSLTSGEALKTGGKKAFRFQVHDVEPGERFSITWKSLWVRLVFSHEVESTDRGSRIVYSFAIRGLFAAPVRWLLQKKLQQNLRSVLHAFAKGLER